MYYSVYIETNDMFHPIILLDETNFDSIKNNIVIPFCKGELFLVDGHKLREKEIGFIKIISTELSIRKCLKLRKSNSFSSEEISFIRNVIDEAEDMTNDLLYAVRKESKNEPACGKGQLNYDSKQVFVVHGHDEKLKLEVEKFLKQLDLEPIILSEQANQGMTIIEKFEKNANVGYGIVLYTQCDKGGTKDTEFENMQFRARQNVIFEHGYLLAKLGRNRVCALVDGDIEIPSDIQGMVYISCKNHWEKEIARELKNADYEIDFNKIL